MKKLLIIEQKEHVSKDILRRWMIQLQDKIGDEYHILFLPRHLHSVNYEKDEIIISIDSQNIKSIKVSDILEFIESKKERN